MTRRLLLALVLLCLSSACTPELRSTADAPLTGEQLAQLWVEPADIASRDLLNGPGGKDGAPDSTVIYRVTGLDITGYSPGYDVVGPAWREWKVKLGEEVQSEIVASRLLWAIGFHQPPTYFVPHLNLEGGRPEDNGRPARFRAEEGYQVESNWSWQENPYVGSQPFKGLLVANLILNNWDLKATNNRIYLVNDPDGLPARRFVVQDLGASLGRTRWPRGDRNNVDAFERQSLIERVENGIVQFDYNGRHQELFRDITAEDVIWTCRLLADLTDDQWQDAFRAANYPEAIRQRFITKLKSKIREGLAIERRAERTP